MRNGVVEFSCAVVLASIAINSCGGRTSSPGGDTQGIAGAANGGGIGGVVNEIGGSIGVAAIGIGGRAAGGYASFNGIGGTANVVGSGVGGGIPTSGTSYCPNAINATPCGGRVPGRWIVESGCLSVSGSMDVSLLGLGCASVPATGYVQVGGIWIANSDGSYEDDTTTTGSVTFTLARACLTISSVPVECAKVATVFAAMGWLSTKCSAASGTCTCYALANQGGGMGVISPFASVSGDYETAGNTLTIDATTQYTYCAAGQTLTMVPRSSAVMGTISLWQNGNTGGSTGF